MKIAVITVGYNRKKPLERLIKSLLNAKYDSDNVDLIISLDFSNDQADMISMANNVDWPHGQKLIISHKKNIGLRKHILSCGDLTDKYDAVVIFEDDIIASEAYYLYLKSALNFYKDEKRLAGISLYSPFVNEMAQRPFMPMPTKYDAFFIKSAQSWGQCWTREMWSGFKEWYIKNSDIPLQESSDMPSRVYSWPESSWKKYFMKYIVETNKYFLYPYVSLSTNASEVGQHNKTLSSTFQVPLQTSKEEFLLPSFLDGIRYDGFFEREGLYWNLNDKNQSICVDLYGNKTTTLNFDLLLTTKKLDLSILQSYSLSHRPHEANFIYKEFGDQIFLYDLEGLTDLDIDTRHSLLDDAKYYSFIPWHTSLLHGVNGLFLYSKRKLFNTISKYKYKG